MTARRRLLLDVVAAVSLAPLAFLARPVLHAPGGYTVGYAAGWLVLSLVVAVLRWVRATRPEAPTA